MRVAIHAGDGDADVLAFTAHLGVLGLDDADLSAADGHALAAGDGIGMLGIVRADHGVKLRAADGFLDFHVNVGIVQRLAHVLAHGVLHAQGQTVAVDGLVQFRFHEDTLRRGAEVAQRGADAIACGEVPHHAPHEVAPGAGDVFGVFLAGAQGGHLGGQVVHVKALLQLGLQVVIVLHVRCQCEFQRFELELRFLSRFFCCHSFYVFKFFGFSVFKFTRLLKNSYSNTGRKSYPVPLYMTN